jgi:DNA-binding NtrC family response regulator
MSDARYIPQSDGQFISSIPQASESTDSTDFIEVQEEVPVSMKELEMANIKSSLDRNNGKRRKTARELGISERTLYRKIKEYNLQ